MKVNDRPHFDESLLDRNIGSVLSEFYDSTTSLRIMYEGKSIDELCRSIVKETINLKWSPGQVITVHLAVEASQGVPQVAGKEKVKVGGKVKGKAKIHRQCYTCGQSGHIAKVCPKRHACSS